MSTFDDGVPGKTGQGAEGEPAFDYKDGYEKLRPEYTRTTQELSELRSSAQEYEELFRALQDPETQAEALAALGFEMESGTPAPLADDEFVDPLEQELASLRAEVTDLRTAREREEDARQETEIVQLRDDFIGESIGLLEKEIDRKISGREEEVLGNLAIAMTGDDGLPDVRGAYDALYGTEGVVEQSRGRWVQSKDNAFQAPLGTSIPADRRPKTPRERAAYIDERLRAQEQDYS